MKEKLRNELRKMNDVDFFLLEHHILIARMIRDSMKRYSIDAGVMGAKLGITPIGMKSALNGAYPFDFIHLARLQKANLEWEEHRAFELTRIKVEAISEDTGMYKKVAQ